MRYDDELRPEVDRQYRAWNAWIAALVEKGQADGSIPPSVDPDRAVERLSAVVDGLESQLLLGLVSPSGAARIVRECIELELGRRPAAAGANRHRERNVV